MPGDTDAGSTPARSANEKGLRLPLDYDAEPDHSLEEMKSLRRFLRPIDPDAITLMRLKRSR